MRIQSVKKIFAILLASLTLIFISSYGSDLLNSMLLPEGHPKFQWSSDYLSRARELDSNYVIMTDIRFYKGGPGITVKCQLNPRCTYEEAYLIFEDLKTILDDEEFVKNELFHNTTIPGNSCRYEILFLNSSDDILYKAVSTYQSQRNNNGKIVYVLTFGWVFVECALD